MKNKFETKETLKILKITLIISKVTLVIPMKLKSECNSLTPIENEVTLTRIQNLIVLKIHPKWIL